MKNYLFCFFLSITQVVFGSPTDSLLHALQTTQGDAKVKVMNELFRAYINSDPVKAIGYSREALDLATDIQDQKGMAASYNNLGVAYRNQGALDHALGYYIKSLAIYQSIDNGEGIATTKNNIGNIYSLKKDYGQALKYFEESNSGFVAMGKTESIIGSMNNLGILHSDLQLYDQALNYFTEAWKLSEKTGRQSADPLTNTGNLYYRQGNYQRAVDYYLRALDIVKKQNDRIGELSLMANLGETFSMANQTGEAQRYLDQALTSATELQASLYLPQILMSLAGNYAKQGKLKEAYAMMVQYDEAKEKVYGEESSRKIAQMNTALELSGKEEQIETLLLDDKVKTLKLRNIQFIVTAIVLAFVSLGMVFNMAFMRKRLRNLK